MLQLLHQTLGHRDAERRQAYIASVRRHHPSPWRHITWTDDMISQCVRHNQSELWPLFSSSLPIIRSDIGRYCILESHGGLYLDSDILVNRNLEEIVQRDSHNFTKVVLAYSPPLLPWKTPGVTNYIMYAPWPRHELWMQVRHAISADRPTLLSHLLRALSTNAMVSQTSGNLMLNSVVARLPTASVGSFSESTIANPFCPVTRWNARHRSAHAVHVGGTARQDGDSWSSTFVLRSVAIECALRQAVGSEYDGQLPCFLWTAIVLCGVVLVTAFLFRRRHRFRRWTRSYSI
jgi:hypothetical protein